MTYAEATDYLFNMAPLFQNIGANAYKEGLANTLTLDLHFGHPHRSYRTIHVAGTNGKGSTSHTLAAILQDAGYKVGLYTSPHLKDFRERIRVNGQMISEQRVIDFVKQERDFFAPLHPSFFELSTALAFLYFKEQKVDVAVIEVGLGGRLDCTNIISPELSIITNISFDHMQFLGNTLESIAGEKAGIIKDNTPVVIGETNGHEAVKAVFVSTARAKNAPILFADETDIVKHSERTSEGFWKYETKNAGTLHAALAGECQPQNTATILCAAEILKEKGFHISNENIRHGFSDVCTSTGLMGRWQCIQRNHPTIVCDIAHNPAGLSLIGEQLSKLHHSDLHIVIGMVSDKDVRHSLSYLPKNARYYFTQAGVKRAMPAQELAAIAKESGLKGEVYNNVKEAFQAAKHHASSDGFIYVGGSTFIVSDLLDAL